MHKKINSEQKDQLLWGKQYRWKHERSQSIDPTFNVKIGSCVFITSISNEKQSTEQKQSSSNTKLLEYHFPGYRYFLQNADSCAIIHATLIPRNMRSKYLVIFFVKKVILLEKWMKKINLEDQLFIIPCPNDDFLEINSGFATHNFLWKPKDSFVLLILALIFQFWWSNSKK